MFIEEVHIQNFKTIKDQKFKFGKLNLLTGFNGSGKSSLSSALGYILNPKSLPEKVTEYINWYADKFVIDAKFNHLSKDYKYNATVGRTTTRTLEFENEKLVNSDATKKLEELIDPVLTFYSAVSAQHESISILKETPTNRLGKLKKIFGMEKLNRVIDLLKVDIQVDKEKLTILKSELAILQTRTFNYSELPTLQDSKELEEKVTNLNLQLDSYNSKKLLYDKFVVDLELYDKAQSNIALLNKEVENFTQELENLKLKPLPDFDKDKLKLVIRDISTLEKDRITYLNLLQRIKDNTKLRESYKESIAKLETEKANTFMRRIVPCKITEDTLKSDNDIINESQVIIASLTKQVELATEGKCSNCGQDYHEDPIKLKELLEETKGKLFELKAEHSRNKLLLQEFEKSTIKNESTKALHKSLDTQIKDFQTKLDTLGEIEQPIEKDFDTLINDLISTSEYYTKLEVEYNNVVDSNSKLELRKKEIEINKGNAQNRIKEYRLVDKPLEITAPIKGTIDIDIVNATKELNIIEQVKLEYDRIKAHNNKTKLEETKVLESITNKTKEFDDITYNIKLLEETKIEIDKNFSSYLITQGTEFIQQEMNNFFQKAYGRYQVILKQNKRAIDFFYTEDGERYSPTGVAGGLEQETLALGFRLALCKMQNLGILILDEIDTASSTEKSIDLYRNILEQEFEQIFCITHKQETKEFLINECGAKVLEMR